MWTFRDWLRLTALGDSAVLLPLAGLLALWLLLAAPTRRAGLSWLLVLLLCAGGVAASKLAYMGWQLYPPGLNFVGLSGHAALSFLVWPALVWVLGARLRMHWRIGLLTLALLLAAAIAVSRLAVNAHTPSETVLGAAWGLMWSSVFIACVRVPAASLWHAGLATLAMVIALALGYGHVVPSNRMLAIVARSLSGHARIYTRCDLPLSVLGRRCGQPRPTHAERRGIRAPAH